MYSPATGQQVHFDSMSSNITLKMSLHSPFTLQMFNFDEGSGYRNASVTDANLEQSKWIPVSFSTMFLISTVGYK